MRRRETRPFAIWFVTLLFAAALPALWLPGCPSVDPGSMESPILEGLVGVQFRATCRFSGPGRGDPLALQSRIRHIFEENLVRAYSLQEEEHVLTADKTILNHPGLLQSLEINRYIAGFVLGCAEDRWVTFYRQDDLLKAEPVHDRADRTLTGSGAMEVSLQNEAFHIHEDVTPQIYTFRKAALRVPIEKVELGFKPEASRMTLTIRDEAVITELRRKVGWPVEEDPSITSSETFAERIAMERTLYAVVAGIVLIEDVIRPGAQVVVDDRGPAWNFGGFVRNRDRDWADALFKREDGRSIEGYVFRIRKPGTPDPEKPESTPDA